MIKHLMGFTNSLNLTFAFDCILMSTIEIE